MPAAWLSAADTLARSGASGIASASGSLASVSRAGGRSVSALSAAGRRCALTTRPAPVQPHLEPAGDHALQPGAAVLDA